MGTCLDDGNLLPRKMRGQRLKWDQLQDVLKGLRHEFEQRDFFENCQAPPLLHRVLKMQLNAENPKWELTALADSETAVSTVSENRDVTADDESDVTAVSESDEKYAQAAPAAPYAPSNTMQMTITMARSKYGKQARYLYVQVKTSMSFDDYKKLPDRADGVGSFSALGGMR